MFRDLFVNDERAFIECVEFAQILREVITKIKATFQSDDTPSANPHSVKAAKAGGT